MTQQQRTFHNITPVDIIEIFRFFDENCNDYNFYSILDSSLPVYFRYSRPDEILPFFMMWKNFIEEDLNYEIIELDTIHFFNDKINCFYSNKNIDQENNWDISFKNISLEKINSFLVLLRNFDKEVHYCGYLI